MRAARGEFTRTETPRMPAKRKRKIAKPDKRTSPAVDPVAEAGAESFPASDAPAWPSGEADPPAARKGTKKKSRSS